MRKRLRSFTHSDPKEDARIVRRLNPKRKTSRRRGLNFQALVARLLRADRFDVYNASIALRRIPTKRGPIFISGQNDIFGADIIAIRENFPLVIFIQASLKRDIKKREREFGKYQIPKSALFLFLMKEPRESSIAVYEYDNSQRGLLYLDSIRYVNDELGLRFLMRFDSFLETRLVIAKHLIRSAKI